MTVPEWLDGGLLDEHDRQVIARGGYGREVDLGVMPALLLIDFQHNHVGARRPILEQLDEWPSGGGAGAWQAVDVASELLSQARAHSVPTVYTRFCFSSGASVASSFAGKLSRNVASFLCDAPQAAIVEELAPSHEDLVIDKSSASAFQGTPLIRYLVQGGIDTVILCGVSTSGCVRATAVDAAALGLKVAVVADGVADRLQLSHHAALIDIWMKYGSVLQSHEVTAHFRSTPRSSQNQLAT